MTDGEHASPQTPHTRGYKTARELDSGQEQSFQRLGPSLLPPLEEGKVPWESMQAPHARSHPPLCPTQPLAPAFENLRYVPWGVVGSGAFKSRKCWKMRGLSGGSFPLIKKKNQGKETHS